MIGISWLVGLAMQPGPFMLGESDLANGAHHTRHWRTFAARAPRFNKEVLLAVDRVQASAPQGGGYFIGKSATPTESPIGYPLRLFGRPLLDPPRTTSYCSGASYAALIEALDRILAGQRGRLSEERFEALRMQEPDGSRREDCVKAWGWWNADGPGSHYCLVQYLKIGERVGIEEALPGDFVNISWKSGVGHSVVFLGNVQMKDGRMGIAFWSSQKGTNGLGDMVSPWESVSSVVVVRLTEPDRLFSFDPAERVEKRVPGDPVPFRAQSPAVRSGSSR